MKTTQSNGLIFYSGDLGSSAGARDFLAVELSGGYIRYVFDVGSGPRAILQSNRTTVDGGPAGRPVNDNAWHDVSISRPTVSRHVVRVDGVASEDTLPDSRSVHFDLRADDLHIGGVARRMFAGGGGLGGGGGGGRLPRQVRSKDGFQGCLASVELDGERWRLAQTRVEIPEEYVDLILEGCDGE